ncbi:YtxH domain-containing protein [Candidatus Peregrinibacteria bacterium]|nr:YtxH domain-containing protein [Candidatus Peregrinibacteria bacterium]
MARFGKLGWILGLIFGTLFGVLFAPRKGKELRGKIKADRKCGRLGLAPLQDDLKDIGQEIAGIAKDFYESETVQDVVEKGRKKLKELSKDVVGEVADFHYSKIKPLQSEVKHRVHFVKGEIAHGKEVFKKAKAEAKDLKRHVKASVKIGKRAVKEIKGEFKKK